MATSGTVSTTVIDVQHVVDDAFRICKKIPEQVASEQLDTALRWLFYYLSTLPNKGISLWVVKKIIIPLYEGVQSVPTPLGTVDVLNANLRTSSRITPSIASATEGTAANAFDADLATACTQVTPAGSITAQLVSATSIWTFGILPTVSGSWDYVIEWSDDGVTYTPIITKTAQAVVAGEWLWEDVEGVLAHLYYRLRATGTTVLDVTELVYQNTPQEIVMYKLNRDDYSNLPNKTRRGRPTQYWYDKARLQPVITLWLAPDAGFVFDQLVCYTQRHIQDVGAMTDQLEIPQRWNMTIIYQLAKHLARVIKDVDPGLVQLIDRDAAAALHDAWTGEGDGSDAFFRPNIRPYTR